MKSSTPAYLKAFADGRLQRQATLARQALAAARGAGLDRLDPGPIPCHVEVMNR